jgi:hypothetical protein
MKSTFQNGSRLIALATLLLAGQVAWAGPAAGQDPEAANRAALLIGPAILSLILLAVCLKATNVALALFATHLYPARFAVARGILSGSPVKSFLVGIINIVLVLIVAACLMALKIPALLGVILLLLCGLMLVSSRALIYQRIGTRLIGEVEDPVDQPSTRAHCWGGVVTELSFLVPMVGQFAALVVTITTFGALSMAMLSRQREVAPTS